MNRKGYGEIQFFIAAIVVIPFIIFMFTITGITKITIEQPYHTEYTKCVQEKQNINDKLIYCQDVKGINNNNPFSPLFYILTILLFMGGIALFVFGAIKKNKLDALEIEIGKRSYEITKREEEVIKKK